MNEALVTIAGLGLLSITFLVGFAVGTAVEDCTPVRTMRGEAVTRGYAEWKVDPKTGATTWQWKEATK